MLKENYKMLFPWTPLNSQRVQNIKRWIRFWLGFWQRCWRLIKKFGLNQLRKSFLQSRWCKS